MDGHRNASLISTILNLCLLGSALAVGLIAIDRLSPRSDLVITSSLQDRNLAIEKARSESRDHYSFITGFIPGIGAPPAASGDQDKFKVIETPE